MALVSTSNWKGIGELIGVLFLFLFVLFLAYMAARIAGSFQSNMMNKRSNIKVIEVFRLSGNKVLEIVQIGNRYFALAVCKDSVTLLAELDQLELKEWEAPLEPIDFKKILDKFKRGK